MFVLKVIALDKYIVTKIEAVLEGVFYMRKYAEVVLRFDIYDIPIIVL